MAWLAPRTPVVSIEIKNEEETSQASTRMGNTEVKNEEKALSDANKKGRLYSRRQTVRRSTFVGTNEALNSLHVNL